MSNFVRLLPALQRRVEIGVANSRFIASIGPAPSVDEARGFIRSVKNEFADADHNVPAFIIGHGPSIVEHCHDDGEPSGTAGRPALAVLRGSGLGDVVVVVTRYFGGTRLGKGGLVRAYGDAVRAALADLPLARKQASCTLSVDIPYSMLDQVRRTVAGRQGVILEEIFAAEVKLTLNLPEGEVAGFQLALTELSHGRILAALLSSDPDARISV